MKYSQDAITNHLHVSPKISCRRGHIFEMVGPKQAKFVLGTILGKNLLNYVYSRTILVSSYFFNHRHIQCILPYYILYYICIFFLVTVSLKRLRTRGSGLTMVAAVSSCELDNGELMCAPNQIIRERFSGWFGFWSPSLIISHSQDCVFNHSIVAPVPVQTDCVPVTALTSQPYWTHMGIYFHSTADYQIRF